MQAAAVLPSDPLLPEFVLPPSGTQFLSVSGYITDRFLVTYRADARRLAALVPRPFCLDTFAGQGFLSVCAVEILGMSIAGMPRLLRFDNREFLYRLAVRLRDEPTFITLRSDVSSGALAVLGRHFSHYRPRLAEVRLERDDGGFRMQSVSADGQGDAVLRVETESACPETSVFPDEEAASRFLLGMSFSADVVRGRVRVQPIDHGPWRPSFVNVSVARFRYVSDLERHLGTTFVYDSTLAVRGVHQTWKAARWL